MPSSQSPRVEPSRGNKWPILIGIAAVLLVVALLLLGRRSDEGEGEGGSDEAAVVASYRLVKSLAAGWDRAFGEDAGPTLGLAIMGSGQWPGRGRAFSRDMSHTLPAGCARTCRPIPATL